MTTTVEILINAKNQASQTIAKVQSELTSSAKAAGEQFEAASVAADKFNAAVQRVMKQHPDFGRQDAVNYVLAMEELKKATDGAEYSMQKARLAGMELDNLFGIRMPRALTTFIAGLGGVGPALASAFSVVAVIGIVDVIATQLPAAFEKLGGYITGWDETRKKAYDHFLEDNKKAIDELTRFQAKMAEISGGQQAGNEVTLEQKLKEAGDASRTAASLRAQANGLPINVGGAGGLLGQIVGAGLMKNEQSALLDQAKHYDEIALAAAQEIIKLKHESVEITAEDSKKGAEEAVKARDERAKIFQQEHADFLNRTVREMEQEVTESLRLSNEAAKKIVENYKDYLKDLEKAGDDYMKTQEYWAKELQQYRDKSATGGPFAEEVKSGEKAGDEFGKSYVKNFKKQQEELIKTFKEGFGAIWDSFFKQGQSVMQNLADSAKKFFASLGKSLFENMASALLFGSNGSPGGSAQGGGLAGSLVGLIGLGGGSKGGGGLLGGLLGGGGSGSGGGLLGGLLSKGGGGLLGGIFGGGAGSGQAAGIGSILMGTGTGTVGTSGGAGLLAGISATGWGAIIAGGILGGIGLYKLLHHNTNAPFTRDPDTYQSREFFFFSGSQALKDAADSINKTMNNISTQPPGILMQNGLPMALQSSQQFTQQISNTLHTGDS